MAGRLTTAFGAFLILCGLVLLLAGRGISCRVGQQQDLARHARVALDSARRAERALQGNNFGMALSAVQGLQDDLRQLLVALDAPAGAERGE